MGIFEHSIATAAKPQNPKRKANETISPVRQYEVEIMASIWRVTGVTADVTFNTHLTSPSSSVLWAGFGPPNSPPYTFRRVKSLGSDEVDEFSEFFVSYLPVLYLL